MERVFDRYTIYEFSDGEIIGRLCQKVKAVRLSCCFSQKEFAEKCGVSIITIKRIESYAVNDITLGTLLKIIPDLPESPYLINEKTGKMVQRFNSKRKSI